MQEAQKLNPEMYASKKIKEAENCEQFLRDLLGSYEADRNDIVAMVRGYRIAMHKVIIQTDL